ncbi:MAG: hypothetical protein HQL34_13125, partial [Alphaproteobacteria bacterium]|nr:hypothetical protein [Alphaproteobacteria bacterium]
MSLFMRNLAKWSLTLVCFIWVGVVGLDQFGEIPESALVTHSSQQIKEQMRDCTGTFKQRYECKDALIVRTGQES